MRLLSGRHLAGLGFGTGFNHEELPSALVEEASALGFPVFEVPYELPFIAITEKAFTRLVNEQYEVLQRGIAIHKRLERLVLEESGLDELVRALAAAIGGAVCVLSARGETIASRTFGASCRRPLSIPFARSWASAPPSSPPITPTWPRAHSSCRYRSAARARPRLGSSPPAMPAGSATSSA